jgi:addiction module HigA family antidote
MEQMSILREDLEAGLVDLSAVVDATQPPIPPIPPGELLRDEWMVPLGLSARALARDLAVPPNRITGIISGHRAITADTALRLARYFRTDAQSWLNLQMNYELEVEHLAHGAEIMQHVQPRAA